MRILIVRLSAIGDVIHTLPVLHALRKAMPQAHIGWVVEDFAAAYLEHNPALDRLHLIPKKRWRGAFLHHFKPEILPFVREIRAEKYDVAIDFQGLTKSGVLARLSGAPLRIGFGDRQGKELSRLFSNRKIRPGSQSRHIIERNLALLEPLLGYVPVAERPVIHFTEEEIAAARQALGIAETGEPLIGLNVGAGWETKRWPATYWAELAQMIDSAFSLKSVLLWGSAAEKTLAEEVLALAGGESYRQSPADPSESDRRRPAGQSDAPNPRLAPPSSLRLSGAMISQLRAYIGGDTGATHLAAALGIPTLGLYGASDALRNGPFWPGSTALQTDTEPCIPCWKHHCPADRPLACLWDLHPARVLQALRELLGNTS